MGTVYNLVTEFTPPSTIYMWRNSVIVRTLAAFVALNAERETSIDAYLSPQTEPSAMPANPLDPHGPTVMLSIKAPQRLVDRLRREVHRRKAASVSVVLRTLIEDWLAAAPPRGKAKSDRGPVTSRRS